MKKTFTLFFIALLCAASVQAFAQNVTVRFKNPGWDKVAVYTYNPELEGGWPGKLLSATDVDSEGMYTYTIAFTETMTGVNLIFNNNGQGQQAADVRVTKEDNGKCWTSDGSACNGVMQQPITIQFSPPADWGNSVGVYTYWNNAEGQTTNAGGWPGKVLADANGDGFFEYTFDRAVIPENANVIFNNNNNGKQAIDVVSSTLADGTCWAAAASGESYVVSSATCPGTLSAKNDAFKKETSVFCNGKVLKVTGRNIESVVLYSINGVKVSSFKGDDHIDLSGHRSGIYLVKVTNDQQFQAVYKVMVL